MLARLLSRCLLCLTLLALPVAAWAQDDDGEGYLTRLLQDTLSEAGRSVDITGFRGALSSRATLDSLTIADDDGVWLEMTGAVLEWNRSALLRGRLDVTELSAETLVISRLPAGDDSADTQASGFAIPDLPVSIDVERLAIGRLVLAEPVIGEAAEFTFDGAVALDDSLNAALSLNRLDRAGQIGVNVALAPEANTLTLDITAEEPENGIAATLLDLPGRPALNLSVQGDGPLDDFIADVLLASDGVERLAGQVTLRGQSDGAQAFAADIGGDLTALLLPQARDFLGDDVQLVVEGASAADGSLTLDALSVRAAAVRLNGSLVLGPDGRPDRFDLSGDIADPEGEPVTLPFGDAIRLQEATISARFDAAESDGVTAEVLMTGFSQPGLALERARLGISGDIVTEGTPSVDIRLQSDLGGLTVDDPGLQEALGSEVTASAQVNWISGGEVNLRDLNLEGSNYNAQMDATLTPGGGTSILTAAGRAAFEDLSRLAQLSGLDLSGSADLGFDVSMDLLGGSFAVSAEGGTNDLALGIEAQDPVLGGDARLAVAASRGPDGITLDQFDLTNGQIGLEASGALSDTGGRFDYAARLANSGAFTGTSGGPLALEGVVLIQGDETQVTLDGGGSDLRVGIDQVDRLLAGETTLSAELNLGQRMELTRAEIATDAFSAQASGDLTAGQRDVTLRLRLPDSGVVLDGGGGPLDAVINAVQDGEAYLLDLTATGQNIGTGIDQVDALLAGQTDVTAKARLLGSDLFLESADISNAALRAQADGLISAALIELDFNARLNRLRDVVAQAPAQPVTATGMVRRSDGALTLDVDVEGAGITASAEGVVADGRTDVGFDARVADLRSYVPQAPAGPVTATGSLQQAGGALSLDVDVSGSGLSAQADGTVAGGRTDVTFNARVADLSRFVPQAPAGPLSARGTVRQENGQLALNIDADGAGGTAAQVSGRVGLPGGAVDLDITGTAPLALANPYIAPQAVTGQASFDLAMNGQPGPEALSGRVTVSGARATAPELGLAIDNLGGGVVLSSGRANVEIGGTVNGGQVGVRGSVGLSGNFPADIVVNLNNVPVEKPGLVTTRANGQITVSGGLTAGGTVAGRIGLRDTELRIPAGGFGGVTEIPEMRHINESAGSRATRAKAGLIGDGNGAGGSGGSSGLNLNLAVQAETPIFLRGRGIDAELQGGLILEGTTNDIRPVGQFDLARGRIDILTKRLDLTEGRIRLAGAFDPIIRLVAESQSGEYVIQIVLEGAAAQPEVVFTSRPELPEDEVLSQLFFERDIASLSPFQAARLALAVAELTGRGNGGVVGSLREGAGLDDLDVSQTAEGETSLSAGKYISDNVYTEVEATSAGKTSLSINLDVTDSLTAKGKVGSDGDSSLGIFFEKDY